MWGTGTQHMGNILEKKKNNLHPFIISCSKIQPTLKETMPSELMESLNQAKVF